MKKTDDDRMKERFFKRRVSEKDKEKLREKQRGGKT